MAKQQAKIIVCRSNVRSMTTGLLLFLEGNDNKFFVYNNNLWVNHIADNIGDIDEVRYCPEILAGVDDQIQKARAAGGTQWGTSRDPWVFRTIDASGDVQYDAGGLCFNGWLYGDDNKWVPDSMKADVYANVSDVSTPYKTPVFADGNWVDSWPRNTNIVEASFDYSIGDKHNGTSEYAMGRYLVNRHRNMRINMAFLDGHVEMMDMENMWTLNWHRNAQPTFDFELPEGVNRNN